jgi:5'-3' exonuclease
LIPAATTTTAAAQLLQLTARRCKRISLFPKERKRDAQERCVVCIHTHTHSLSLVQYLSRYMYHTCTIRTNVEYLSISTINYLIPTVFKNIFHVISSIAHLLTYSGSPIHRYNTYVCTYICIHHIISMHIHRHMYIYVKLSM